VQFHQQFRDLEAMGTVEVVDGRVAAQQTLCIDWTQ
jgi:hypothetical protein